jgi:FMN phosphatase YigB (HAD superfamily)
VFPATQNRWVTFDLFGTLLPRTPPAEALRKVVGGDLRAAARPFGDVEPLLAELRLRGLKLGVLTNQDDTQFEAAHRTFRKPFDLFVTAERIRARKPDLWHFRAFQLMSQVKKDHWIHIASDWQHDIVPAEVFGIQRVWLDRDGTGEDPSRATVHVRTAADAVKAVDWLFQEQAACAC